MRTLVIFEDDGFSQLLPLTYWRTCSELRTGYDRLYDHIVRQVSAGWARPDEIHIWCRPELAAVTSNRFEHAVNAQPEPAPSRKVLYLNSRLLLKAPLQDGPAPAVQWRNNRPVIIHADEQLARALTPEILLDPAATHRVLAAVPHHEFVSGPKLMDYPWDLVHANPEMLHLGWRQAGEPAQLAGRICEGVYFLNRSAIHIGEGSTIKPGVVLDAEHGPIYIGRNVTVSPNTSIEGPCYIGDDSLIQAGTSIRDAVSIGRRCKVGGELESSILHGFSNKQHDGFLGHSYVAEWVNLAADTVNSDLKNTYGTVRVPINGVEVDSGQMFVGLTIGDHSKTGIGQMFPTGAVVGFGCNIAICEFAPKFVPSFTWMTSRQACTYSPERCLEIARRVMARRQTVLTPAEEAWFLNIPAYVRKFERTPG
ncbi:MAG TPA: putative sugar nucleotidyl transferase [Phycisphaerae bacterium]|nr:putative sugar nucleotidyl transferase [Phycisphaerae bacterium]HOJ73127.1 putative sugar nucleotidyl transferase [Phycisphaerae bacterium]HOM52220.1 putative sugar nucleotidyl transferase [Phycisphaerae bacterium]HOQ85209.1 putative sugar nucleotidyl transferase [Phycisphaerae bacterium]HPP25435.1 putative sugar nucleotidyl transferase [Phycisphaerae bacterium]